jgi:creatinine amidohydrolase/Fe(II)-dependent formamide hydrolase-like protein
MRMADMTSAEIRRKVEKESRVVLPWGPRRKHGRHLPLQTDTIAHRALVDIVRKVKRI